MSNWIRKRQRKLERARDPRPRASKALFQYEPELEVRPLAEVAQSSPFGPCWVSNSLDEPPVEGAPPLVTVLVTRQTDGPLLAVVALVDRTCLGVKHSSILLFQSANAVRSYIVEHADSLGALRECEPSEAQSVVLHALEYSAALGFSPHVDFEPAIVEPRPAVLRETPLAHPPRCVFVPGPNDNVARIVEQLDARLGRENYEWVATPPSNRCPSEPSGRRPLKHFLPSSEPAVIRRGMYLLSGKLPSYS